MHLRKISYSRDKFEEYTFRRHNVIKNLAPLMRMYIDDQNIYGYRLTRMSPISKSFIPIRIIELYGHAEYKTMNIESLLSYQDNTKTFGARINKIDIHRELLVNEKDLSVEYLIDHANVNKKTTLPTINEIADISMMPPSIRDRFATERVPENYRNIDNRLREFEINIGSILVQNVLEDNR